MGSRHARLDRSRRESIRDAARLAMAHKLTGGLTRIRNVPTDGLRYRLVDARGEVVGRLASKLSLLLQGKDKPTYSPDRSDGDVVVVVNAADVTLTGRKLENKKYYRHTGYVGGLVTRTAGEMMRDEPCFVLRKAVERMLPKNQLRRDMLRKLRVFPGEAHALVRPRRPTRCPTRAWRTARNASRWCPFRCRRACFARRRCRGRKSRRASRRSTRRGTPSTRGWRRRATPRKPRSRRGRREADDSARRRRRTACVMRRT